MVARGSCYVRPYSFPDSQIRLTIEAPDQGSSLEAFRQRNCPQSAQRYPSIPHLSSSGAITASAQSYLFHDAVVHTDSARPSTCFRSLIWGGSSYRRRCCLLRSKSSSSNLSVSDNLLMSCGLELYLDILAFVCCDSLLLRRLHHLYNHRRCVFYRRLPCCVFLLVVRFKIMISGVSLSRTMLWIAISCVWMIIQQCLFRCTLPNTVSEGS